MSYINLGQVVYPVGSIFISIDSTSPADLFGGNWTQLYGACIRAAMANDINKPGSFIGADQHTLIDEEMPTHSHAIGGNSQGPDSQPIVTNYFAATPVWLDNPQHRYVCHTAKRGSSKPHNNVPRAFQTNIWYRTA